jgi:DNA-directed RNA polymerase subunit RPC12/RpoP
VLTRQAAPFALPAELAYTAGDGVPLGKREDGELLAWDLDNQLFANALFAGPPGSGKSNALRCLIAGAARTGALIDVIDPKLGEDFELFADHPGIRVWTDPADWLRILTEFADEIRVRAPTRGRERDALPHRLLIIDETSEAYPAMAGLGRTVLAEYVEKLQSIARKGRAYKLHLVLATQKPVAKSLTGDPTTGSALRDLCLFRVGLGKLSNSAAKMVFDLPSALPVPAIAGRGQTDVDGELMVVQIFRLDGPEAAELAAAGTGRFPAPVTPVPPTEAPPAASPLPCPVPAPTPPAAIVDTRSDTQTHAEPSRVGEVSVDTQHTPQHTLSCYRCGHGWLSAAKPGSSIGCPECGHRRRVPKGT